ncbi:uncharacterized protein F5Z01DRAFT_717581 [Emericellopsis atlantica]|uniref:CorA family metal ion transporter n=1 Tax=Emericellopsis atlantica TaxID=2614577 RepID=A0A9P7ZU95_9HYPO|nr:uncharacterized protein F5Z01DRAFT_717581 [Emericellopsis atlantica]KAG9257882.1 hypothetical protein F5Z01DRAFT_717581 [Emericellopsis atlantica]
MPGNEGPNRFNPLSGLAKSLVAERSGASQAQSHAPQQPTSAPNTAGQASQGTQAKPPKKRKNHRGGKKKRQRRKSFAIIDDDENQSEASGPSRQPLYQIPSATLSDASFDSEALLDHREHQPMRARRSSTVGGASAPLLSPFSTNAPGTRLRTSQAAGASEEAGDYFSTDERAPLLSQSARSQTGPSSYGAGESRGGRPKSHGNSSVSSNARRAATAFGAKERYDINNPPSVPGSPTFSGVDRMEMTLGDVMIRDELDLRDASPRHSRMPRGGNVDDEDEDEDDELSVLGGAVRDNRPDQRLGEDDVCYPGPDMSEMGDERQATAEEQAQRPRRRRGQWPDLSILEEWKHMEKEDRSEERRVKTITEPQLINGRLRPVRKGWFETEEDVPFRFTYFNEEFQSTIHSQTISELVQPGGSFAELFIPEPRVLSDDESESGDETPARAYRPAAGNDSENKGSIRTASFAESKREGTLSPKQQPQETVSGKSSGEQTPTGLKFPETGIPKPVPSNGSKPRAKNVRYGDRPIWWLDILCPTEAEMKVIAKAFGIHPLTAEDIMLQEAREKVELFRNYYFVNYRTFDQDINSDNYLEPVNMYVVVFREGVLSFHFSVTPHPANVRRRIRQLRDYLILSSDWISYAIIDDITDVFQPLIQNIEDEVDEIDDGILRLHSVAERRMKDANPSKTNDEMTTVAESTGDMLRRVGDCRKRVMSLYRLLGNKADVIKGFAKRCNERWEVAPRSEIGLYLGDIQDHIITMTSNLGHYEKILARSHGNYLAQINIRMNERQEQTADVLGKLTVLGTIVLPMNIITGLWGMNVWVPGQEYEGDLTWFVCITAGLILFGLACYMIAKRVYKIV